jgi:DNA-binding transcriptional LysR family regulator
VAARTELCEAAGFTPRIAYTSDDVIVDQALVAAGLGVTTMPGLALASYQADGGAATELANVKRRVYVATFGTPPDSPATTAFVTALRDAADAHLHPTDLRQATGPRRNGSGR